MSAARILSGARGIVRAECAGGFFERFLSEALKCGIEPFDVVVEKERASFCVAARDYKRLKGAARRSQCRMRVTQRQGLYFKARRIKRLLPLAVGLLTLMSVMWLLGSRVVAIDIKGSSAISRAEITASLERCGLRVGMARADVEVQRVEQGVLIDNERLAWAALNLSYGRAVIELRDKLEDSYAAQQGTGYIIAARDAQIIEITLVSGEPLVKAGDIVTKGQTLVAPSELTNAGSWTAGVSARVRARTYRRERFETGLFEVRRERTGRTSRERSLSLFNLTSAEQKRRSPYRWFDTLEYSEPVALFDFELPLRLETTEYLEISQRTCRLTASSARALLENMRADYEKEQLTQADILYMNSELLAEDTGWALEAEYICREEIGEYYCP